VARPSPGSTRGRGSGTRTSPEDEASHGPVDIGEAVRQLDLAAHDIAVASTCIGLGDLNEAHINVITARAAADAAEEILRVAIMSGGSRQL
jgi:hypothetical protein